jgi:hypothetical protein
MDTLLSFLSAFFYVALAIIVGVAIIEQRWVTSRSATEQPNENVHRKAA